eukprot:scaffold55527_cov59-Phaeocystis_antarctica.AAC.3
MGTCGSGLNPSSGLECTPSKLTVFPKPSATCQPNPNPRPRPRPSNQPKAPILPLALTLTRSIIGTVCNPNWVGTCGGPASGLICVPSCLGGFFPPLDATCQPKFPVEGSTCCPEQTCADGGECVPNSIIINPSICEKPTPPPP